MTTSESAQRCAICLQTVAPAQIEEVRCNVRKFRDRSFLVWRCAACLSLHCEKVEDLAEYYNGYPIRNEKLDYFLRAWYRVILRRLVRAGLKEDHRILDYGCNQGLFIRFLAENGYRNCSGYDPYVDPFRSTGVLNATYDCVVSLDVIEHDEDPRIFLERLVAMMRPNGLLCIETPNAEGIMLSDSEEYLHALHVPYHIHILSEQALSELGRERGLRQVAIYNRWYMDSWEPGTARRLFEAVLKFSGNDLDAGYEPPRVTLFVKHPALFFHLFFGYFGAPRKNDHMMMLFSAAS